MKKTIFIIGLASVVGVGTGCIFQDNSTNADRFREGIPSKDQVTLQEPVAQGATSTRSFEPGMAFQDSSNSKAYATYYRFTREMFDGVNLGTAAILGSIWIIVSYPPTTLEDSEAVWGPWTEALAPAEYRFRASEVGAEEYEYALEARAKNSKDVWQAVWLGQGFGSAHPNHRSGWFELDFDTANEVDPTRLNADNESGRIRVTYDLRSYPTMIHALGTEQQNDSWFNIQVTTHEDGGGRVDIEALDDLDETKATLKEEISMRSRWLATGAGRADVTVANGDLPSGMVVHASECWAASFERVFWTDSIGIEPQEGSESICAFDGSE